MTDDDLLDFTHATLTRPLAPDATELLAARVAQLDALERAVGDVLARLVEGLAAVARVRAQLVPVDAGWDELEQHAAHRHPHFGKAAS